MRMLFPSVMRYLSIPAHWIRLKDVLGGSLVTAFALGAWDATAASGTVTFANHGSTKIINGHTLAPITAGDGIKTALYWAPPSSNTFVQIGAAINVGVPVAGIFCGGTRTTGPATVGGGTGQFQVRAWGGGFDTYEQAISASVLIGQSAILQVTTGNPEGDAPTPPGSLIAGGLQTFALLTNTFQALIINCAASKTVECGDPWTFDLPTTSGGCASNPVITVLSTTTNGFCRLTATCTWRITDGCSTNTCSQTVTVADTIPPLLTCASNKTVACGGAWEFDAPTAYDACSGTNVTIGVLSTITNVSCPVVITRTWMATDICGNSNGCSQSVTVVDMTSLVVQCPTNKVVNCEAAWDFDPPSAGSACNSSITIAVLTTSTNAGCPRVLTRIWGITNLCNGDSAVCSQVVTVICPDCPVLTLAQSCPPHPVPPGGILAFTGTVTNTSSFLLTNVIVLGNRPLAGTPLLGPVTLLPGEGTTFGNRFTVDACGPYENTLTATGLSPSGILFSNSLTTACPGATVFVPGDRDGDGIIDQNELNSVLSNYWAHSGWVYMTNATSLGGGVFQFALTNLTGWNFSVLASTNLQDWTNLPGPAYPVYQFTDPESSNAPVRLYRLRWP